MARLIDVFAPTRQTIAGMGQAFGQAKEREVEEEERMANVGARNLQTGINTMRLEGMQKQKADADALSAHMSALPEGADREKEQLNYLKGTNVDAAMEFGRKIRDKGAQIMEFDPKGGVDYLNKKFGMDLKYSGKQGNLIKVTDEVAGVVKFLDPKTAKHVKTVKITPKPLKTDKRTKTIVDLELEDEVTNRFEKEGLSKTDARLKAQSLISENKKGKGITMSVDEAGNPVINIGGKSQGPELTKGAKTDVQKKLLESNATYSDMKAVVNKVEDKFLEMPTKIGNKWTAFKEKWKIGDVSEQEKQDLKEYTSFKRDSIASLNNYIKQITGAAMSELEAKRLMKAMPTPGIGLFDGDSPTEFNTKLSGVMESLDRVTARNNYVAKHGLSSFEDVGLDQIDGIIDRRGEKLESDLRKENPGMGNKDLEKQIMKTLSEEFGIRF